MKIIFIIMNKYFLITILLISYALAQNTPEEEKVFQKYQKFLHKFNKTYSTVQELNQRFQVFLENYQKLVEIRNLNDTEIDDSEEDRLHLGVTEFFDLSDSEFQSQYLSYSVSDEELHEAQTPSENNYQTTNETETDNLRHLQVLPASFDWRSRGAVGVVKNQGSCGVCYAFAVTGNIEGLYKIKYGQLLNFSEQQILNCDRANYGCSGGVISKTYDYLTRSNGLGLSSSLRYTQRRSTCTAIRGVARIAGKRFSGSTNSNTIAAMLVNNGPLAAGVNANYFKYYRGGVMSYSSYQCSSRISHAVTIVGYGKSANGIDYWIVKNSWGPYWGENGYIRIKRGSCGINSYVLTGILA